jgi:hypothetical protein
MSSFVFTLDDSINKPFIHLTNNAIQKSHANDNYGKYEDGNCLSFNKASELLLKQNNLPFDFYAYIDSRIKPIIISSLKSVQNKLDPFDRKFCFEIFGYDFMVDEKLNPWLIEVNTNPCLEETSKLLKQFIPRMIDDTFKLTLDVIFSKVSLPLPLPQPSTEQPRTDLPTSAEQS